MDSRVDTHGHFVGVVARDALVHIEEVAVLGGDCSLAQATNGLGEVQVDAATHNAFIAFGIGLANCGAYATTFITHVLGLTRCDITRH